MASPRLPSRARAERPGTHPISGPGGWCGSSIIAPRSWPRSPWRRSRPAACSTSSGERGLAEVWAAAVAVLAAELTVEVAHASSSSTAGGRHDRAGRDGRLARAGRGARGRGCRADVLRRRGAWRDFASARARRELTALIQRAPKVAQLRVDGGLRGGAGRAGPGRRCHVVRTGEVVPVDGTVSAVRRWSTPARSAASRCPKLCGEGCRYCSGTANAGSAVRRSAPSRPRPKAPTRRSYVSSNRRRRNVRRSCAWLIATRRSFCPPH